MYFAFWTYLRDFQKCKLLLTRDFNLPNIGWVKNSFEDFLPYEGNATNILEKIEVMCECLKRLKPKQCNFLSHFVNNTLDLVFSDKEDVDATKALENIIIHRSGYKI